ncbi:MAG: ABC transporter ATP-binding protein [Candidatus Omnitrophota bacterium]|jgi:ABC-type dipeptide/oligopeptide/nickel transport system ATPase component
MDDLLKIRGLKINFYLGTQVITAVDGFDLDIGRGEVVVLAGESGSGKTVSALAITRILPRNARVVDGSIIFDGQDLLGLDIRQLRAIRGKDISYVFQEPSSYLNPVYTVGDQIMEAIRLHQNKTKQEAYAQTLKLLEAVKIADPARVAFSYPHQMSGGMNQRAFIAMSLASRPQLLIADEPTTALDVTIESEILQLLLTLKDTLGFSLLFITHNLTIARRIADRVAVMYQGKIVETAPVESIFTDPKHFHTKELISAYEQIGRI